MPQPCHKLTHLVDLRAFVGDAFSPPREIMLAEGDAVRATDKWNILKRDVNLKAR